MITPIVPVSVGNLIDRMSILQIKLERIDDTAERAIVRHNLDELEAVYRGLGEALPARLAAAWRDLKAVNEILWDTEDAVRRCEREGDFGPRFVELARRVYHCNDERSAHKRRIDRLAGSAITEVKQHPDY